MRRLEDQFFLALVVVISLAFAWLMQPFFGAILWGVVAAIIFVPLNRLLLRKLPQRRSLAALLTLLIIIALVIIPAIILASFLFEEAAAIYAKIQSGQVDFGRYFEQVFSQLPDWASKLLARFGLTDFDAVRTRISSGLAASFQTLAAQAFNIGQSAFGFIVALGVMLYLTFFLLRDGDTLAARVDNAIPLRAEQRRVLIKKFVTVTRATIKGSLVVAILQGAIGGITFSLLGIHGALLWGVLMGFFSLVPAVGTGLIWVPVAIYLLATGAIWQGIVLILCGVFIIGMVDNVLRPVLVGRDVRMPDYLVLISTLGGLEIFGFSGFIIGPVIAALFLATWESFAATKDGQTAPGAGEA